ncbi:MAG TPA: hypothetical protein VGL80_13105 [Pseudonocardiaceae bacterium]|jgi:alpha-tubulin suppressor-like RCC1 family protein
MRRCVAIAAAAILSAGVVSTLGAATAAALPVAQPVTGGDAFVPVVQQRILDTRSAGGPLGPLGTRQLVMPSVVPAQATAVVLNLTAVAPTTSTFISVYQFNEMGPQPATPPGTSTLNVAAGETRANQVTVALTDTRSVELFNHAGTVNLLADVAGYYAPTGGAGFTAVGPVRVLDTRNGTGHGGSTAPVGAGRTITLDLSTRVPATATAVTFNLTAIGGTAASFVTAYPGTVRPNVSSLNVAVGATTPNLVTVQLGPNRTVTLFNNAGSVHLVADLAGFYATGAGDLFYPIAQFRVADMLHEFLSTVTAVSLTENGSNEFDLSTWLPRTAHTAVLNLTGVDQGTVPTVLTAFAHGTAQPLTSNVNLAAGQATANAAVVPLSAAGQFDVHNGNAFTSLLFDLEGYFAPAIAACATTCVQSWGDNFEGDAADGTYGIEQTPPAAIPGLSSVVAVTGQNDSEFALKADGTVWAWGNDLLGLGTPPVAAPLDPAFSPASLFRPAAIPAQVVGLSSVVAIAPFVAVRADGTVWSFGHGAAPAQIPGLTGITAVAIGVSDLALKSDGTVWVWHGPAGNGSATPVTTATQVPGLTGVTAVAGGRAAYVLEADGTVWAWGDDNEGELGDGTATTACGRTLPTTGCQALGPVQVHGLTGVVSVAGQVEGTAYAVRSDGTAVAWGDNEIGEILGSEGTTPGVGTPRVLSGITAAVRVAATAEDGVFLTSTGTVQVVGALRGYVEGNDLFNEPALVAGISGATGIGTDDFHVFALTPTA